MIASNSKLVLLIVLKRNYTKKQTDLLWLNRWTRKLILMTYLLLLETLLMKI